MLQYIAGKSTDFLFSKTEIDSKEREIYQYGFELFWSTFLSLSSMIVLAIIFDYVPQILVFISFLIPIRMVAGGAHASSYKNCWFISNLVAIGCVVAGDWLSRFQSLLVISVVLLIVAIVYIWRVAPVRLAEDPQSEQMVKRNRKYSHVILVAEVVWLLGFMCNGNGSMYYTAAITSYIVAIMIWIAIRKERRKCHE